MAHRSSASQQGHVALATPAQVEMKVGAIVKPEAWAHHKPVMGIVVQIDPGDVIGVLLDGNLEWFIDEELKVLPNDGAQQA